VTKKEAKELEALRVMVRELSKGIFQEYENFLSARGRKGARALAKKLGEAGRKARAQKAARARWSRAKEAQ